MSDRRQMFQYVIDQTLTGSGSAVATVNTQGDSFFVVQKIIALSTGRFTASILGGLGSDASWSDKVVNDQNLFGTAQRPFILLDPIILAPSTAIVVSLADVSTSTNVVQIVFEGYKDFDLSRKPDDIKYRWPFPAAEHTFFQYVSNVSLTANAQGTDQIRMQAGAHFVLRQIVATSNPTGTARAFKFRLSNSGNGQQFSQALVSDANAAGTAQRPSVLHQPVLFEPNTVVGVEYTEFSGNSNTVQLVLCGSKIFRGR